MLKRVLISIIIIIMMFFSLNIYATEGDSAPGEAAQENTETETNENQNQTENVTGGDENKPENPDTNTEHTGNEQGNEQENDNPQTGNNENENNTHITGRPSDGTTTVVESKSKENNLKSLNVDIEGITPEFNKNTTEYYLVVDLTVEQIKVTATPVDEKATVTISGNTNLQAGENTIKVVVKAEDGTEKTYYIYVNKVDDIAMANAQLGDLKVTDYNIYPSFKPTIYNYNIDIKNNVKTLEIIANAENEKSTIVIEGNEELKQGENIIKIIVTAEDGKTVRTYKINAYVASEKGNLKEENKTPAIVLLVIIGTSIVVLAVFEYNKFRKNRINN